MDLLTVYYNQSFIKTYDFAVSGATIDNAIVPALSTSIASVRQQVETMFLTRYASKPADAPWTSANSLFGVFIGINDLDNSYTKNQATTNTALVNEYAILLEKLYQSGARNFLVLNVPPVERTPFGAGLGSGTASLKADIADCNSRVAVMLSNLAKNHTDATSFLFDTNSYYNQALNNLKAFSQTAGITNTAGTGTSSTYFWRDVIHPNVPIHNVTAEYVAKLLQGTS